MKRFAIKVRHTLVLALAAIVTLIPAMPGQALASSHMDAPLITRDPSANTTDVYAFITVRDGVKFLNLALGVYPHENPGIGPNKYNFDENVRYEMHVALGNDVAAGRATITYRFEFETKYKTQKTILQSYVGVVQNVDDASQNLTQTYSVTRIDNRTGAQTLLGTALVPPNNQGNATPLYNQGDNGENQAKNGVATNAQLDLYTRQSIKQLNNGYVSFAGQRDDGFYADVQSVFDLLKLRRPGVDSQGGYNLHLMALAVPVSDLGGDQQTAGVYATTSREVQPILRSTGFLGGLIRRPQFTQVARQGNPLFNEGLVAIEDKDLYSRSSPSDDSELFRKYAETPELAALINALLGGGQQLAIPTGRVDIAAIFIPDVIKIDLSTDGAALAGNGKTDVSNPDDAAFNRLSIFGGDILESRVVGHPFRLPGSSIGAPVGRFFVPGGWPNGRRFGDDVLDIAVIALLSDLRDPLNLKINTLGGDIDGVTANDKGYNKTFPYESTPHNGRDFVTPK